MNYVDLLVGQSRAAIWRLDSGIVPVLDTPEEDSGKSFRRKAEISGKAIHVVNGNNRANGAGKLYHRTRQLGDLAIIQGHIRGGKIRQPFAQPADAFLRSDAFIANVKVLAPLRESRKPLAIERLGKGCSRAHQFLSHGYRLAKQQAEDCSDSRRPIRFQCGTASLSFLTI